MNKKRISDFLKGEGTVEIITSIRFLNADGKKAIPDIIYMSDKVSCMSANLAKTWPYPIIMQMKLRVERMHALFMELTKEHK